MRKKTPAISLSTTLLILAAAIYLFARTRSRALLSFYQDDAFYYFQIARNIAVHHFSSFDGIHRTNGYHPLWMVLLVCLNLVASGRMFFLLVQAVEFVSFILSFLLARRIFRLYSSNPMVIQVAASAVALQCLLLQEGMEVTLALPAMLLVCWYRLRPQFRWAPVCGIGYGILCACLMLSRLDSMIFVALLFLLDAAFEWNVTRETWAGRACAALACIVPMLLYLLSNHVWFHVWMPVSGQAKMLRLHHWFTLASVRASLGPIGFPYWAFVILPTGLILLWCAAAVFRVRMAGVTSATLSVSISLIVFLLVQFLSFWSLSDWPIWPWYLYSFPLAATGGLVLLLHTSRSPSARPGLIAPLLQGVLTLVFFLVAWTGTVDREQNRTSWYLFAKDVAGFAASHNGIYAMGDCAGTTGYLIQEPVIQLEGLVMDAPFLEKIREQSNLNSVLSEYNVDYYVTIRADREGACYRTTEPPLAGTDSPRMNGSFCQPPIAVYPHGEKMVYIFDLGSHGLAPATGNP